MVVPIVKDGVYKMAWTAPKTWTTDELILASGGGSLNEQIRDNMLALSGHAHTGAAGDGASTLSGVTFTNTAAFQFADQSADPSTTGYLQRNGAELKYYDGSSAIDLTASDAAAGTPSLRSLSNTATTAAAGDHQHSLTSTGTALYYATNGDTGSPWDLTTTGEKTVVSGNYQATGTNKVLCFSYTFFWSNQYNTGSYGEYYTGYATSRMKYNGSTIRSDSNLYINQYNTNNGFGQSTILSIWALANGNVSTAYEFTVDKTDTGGGGSGTRMIYARGKLTIAEIPITMGTI